LKWIGVLKNLSGYPQGPAGQSADALAITGPQPISGGLLRSLTHRRNLIRIAAQHLEMLCDCHGIPDRHQ
jgi:hypothetical protein